MRIGHHGLELVTTKTAIAASILGKVKICWYLMACDVMGTSQDIGAYIGGVGEIKIPYDFKQISSKVPNPA